MEKKIKNHQQQGFRFGFDEFDSLDSIHIAIKTSMYLARNESGADGHIWKEIMKTIHVDADKHRKEIGEACAVLSGSSKAQFLLIVWLAVGRLIQHIYVVASYWYLQVLHYYVLRQLCTDAILLNATKKFTREDVAFN